MDHTKTKERPRTDDVQSRCEHFHVIVFVVATELRLDKDDSHSLIIKVVSRSYTLFTIPG